MTRFRPHRLLSVALILILAGALGACDQAPTAPETSESPSAEAPSSAAMGPTSAETPDRHIVGVTSKGALGAAKKTAESVYRVIELGNYPTAVAGVFSEEARKQLRQRKGVAYIEPDKTYEIIEQTLPWGIDRVDAEVAHSNGETGGDNSDGEGGADLVIIDTGIDDDHEDLQDNLATPLDDESNHKAFATCKGPNCNYAWSDDHDHGTHVSGIADAVNNSVGVVGVSTEATLHAAKVCDKSGFCSSSDIAAALDWTAKHGYDVANLSLGGSYSQTIDNAGKNAYDDGVLLVAAAGNDGPCTDCVGFPAANEEFIAVSATDIDDNLAGFSSTGCEVELAGPGDDIFSSVIGGYDTFSGTSMSSPHVAGAGAQLMDNGYANATQSSSDAESADCFPTDPGGARGKLQDSAEDIGLAANEQGNGLVDVAAALGLDSSDDLSAGPTVDNLSLDEVETDDSDAEFDASWEVSDSDDNLDSVELTLYELDSDGNRVEAEDTATEDVSGGSASGTTRLVATGDDGSGNTYEVEAVVSDTDGNTDSATATETESEDTSGDNAPSASIDGVSEVNSNSPHAEFDITWSASDSDGDLDSATLTLHDDTDGEREDSETFDISGDTAGDTTTLKAKFDEGSGNSYTAELVVTDSNGNTDTATASFSEDGS